MLVFPDFQDELQKLNPRLTIVLNPNRPNLANIKLDGVDVCPIPASDIRDEADPNYSIEIAGRSLRHKTRPEALDMVAHILKVIDTPDGADAFFGRNGYFSFLIRRNKLV